MLLAEGLVVETVELGLEVDFVVGLDVRHPVGAFVWPLLVGA